MHGIEYQQSGQTAKKSFWYELFFTNESFMLNKYSVVLQRKR